MDRGDAGRREARLLSDLNLYVAGYDDVRAAYAAWLMKLRTDP